MKIAVVGSGSWGTAVAHIAASLHHNVTILTRNKALAEEINLSHTSKSYLPGVALEKTLLATVEPATAFKDSEILLLAVPAQHLASALLNVKPFLPSCIIPVCLSKGIEIDSLKLMSEVVGTILPACQNRYAILSGPSFAEEAAKGLPTAIVLGCANSVTGTLLRNALSGSSFRIYTNSDVIGVELGGAVKNVIAIAAGICDGLGLGDNARAALITRGLAEITRLGQSMGANPTTFMGLSGLGDLILTCTGALSRNRRAGLRIGQGATVPSVMAELRTVEGIATTKAVYELSLRNHVAMPIVQSMFQILYNAVPPAKEVQELLARDLKDE